MGGYVLLEAYLKGGHVLEEDMSYRMFFWRTEDRSCGSTCFTYDVSLNQMPFCRTFHSGGLFSYLPTCLCKCPYAPIR